MDIIFKSNTDRILLITNEDGINLTIRRPYATFENHALDLDKALMYIEMCADMEQEFTCTVMTSHGAIAELGKTNLRRLIDRVRFVTGNYTEKSIDRLMGAA